MTKAIVLELTDGNFRCHEVDADPEVERWAIAFVDTDGAAWVYMAWSVRSFVVTGFVDEPAALADDEPAECDIDGGDPTPNVATAPDRFGVVVDGEHAGHREICAVTYGQECDLDCLTPAVAPSGFEVFRPQPRRKYDLATVAEHACHALANGLAMSKHVAEQMGMTEKVATKQISDARARGHDIPAGRPGRVAGQSQQVKYDRQIVADVACRAIELGEPAGKAVAVVFGCSDWMGTWLIARARQAGHVIPTAPRGPRTDQKRTPKPAPPPPAPKPRVHDGWTLIPPPAPPKPVPFTVVTPDPPVKPAKSLEAVAAFYLEVEAADLSFPLQHVADRFRVPRSWARAWVAECRTLGLLPPRDQPQVERVAPAPRAVPRGHY